MEDDAPTYEMVANPDRKVNVFLLTSCFQLIYFEAGQHLT